MKLLVFFEKIGKAELVHGFRNPRRFRLSSPRSGRLAGFTLLEALVALTIVLAFAAALGPLLSQARRIMTNADGRIAAQIRLRALLQAPLDRSNLANLSREGEDAGLQWQLAAVPAAIDTTFPHSLPPRRPPPATAGHPVRQPSHWLAYRVVARVSWAPGQTVSAETVRLAQLE